MSQTTATEAELAVIGSLLQQPQYAEQVCARLTPLDFVQHEGAATVLWAMFKAGRTVDPQTFRAELTERHTLPREEVAPFIVAATEAAWMPASVGAYADEVYRATQRRRLLGAAQQLSLAVEGGGDVADAAADAVRDIERVVKDVRQADAPSMTLAQLLATPVEYDWVIPGLLERTERFLVSAGEGSGKSTLLRQVAMCAACGVHPFTLDERIPPVRVLVVDCENSQKQSARKFRQLVATMRDLGFDPGDNLVYQSRPEGLELTSQRDASWLLNRVIVDEPQLLTIGPVNRLCAKVADDDVVSECLRALDAARLRGGCALLIETHPSQGTQYSATRDLRPKGSTLWRSWPEAIRALRRDADDPKLAYLEMAGRGDRDPRHWPRSLREGYADELPWVALTDEDADAKRSLRSVS